MLARKWVGVALAVAAFGAQAAPITFEFAGTITNTRVNAFNGADEFPGADVGDPFSGHITFDPDTYLLRQDSVVSPTSRFTWDGTPLGMTIEVSFGGFTLGTDTSLPPSLFLAGAAGHSQLFTANDWTVGSTTRDQFNYLSQTRLPSGNYSGVTYMEPGGMFVQTPAAFIELSFLTYDLSVLASQDILLAPPDLASFENRRLAILGGFPNVFLEGFVESLALRVNAVPEPSPLALLLVVVMSGVFAARRTRQRAQRR